MAPLHLRLLSQVPVQLSPELPAEHLPRLCCLVKGDNDYGFYLHSYKTRSGQYVRLVEPGSAAEIADVRPGDRIMEVKLSLANRKTRASTLIRRTQRLEL